MDGCLYFVERETFLKENLGAGDSMSSPWRSPTGAATHSCCEGCRLATHSWPPGELSSAAGRCHLTWKVNTPPRRPQPMSDWHWDTKVHLPCLKRGETHWVLSSRALCLCFRPKLDFSWDHILPRHCLASLTPLQVLPWSLNKSPVLKSLPQALLLVNLT